MGHEDGWDIWGFGDSSLRGHTLHVDDLTAELALTTGADTRKHASAESKTWVNYSTSVNSSEKFPAPPWASSVRCRSKDIIFQMLKNGNVVRNWWRSWYVTWRRTKLSTKGQTAGKLGP